MVEGLLIIKFTDFCTVCHHFFLQQINFFSYYFSSLEEYEFSLIFHSIQAKDLRLRTIGRLRSLHKLDGRYVNEEEVALALRCAAGSRISQLSLLTYSRTDTEVPRSLTLGDCTHNITLISRNKPVRESEDDVSWYSKVSI